MGPAGCPACGAQLPQDPLTAGALWGLHSTATTRHEGGEEQSSRCPLSPALSPCWGWHPGCHFPQHQRPCAEQLSRAGTHAALDFPLPWTCTTPSHQTRTPPSLITATTQTPAFTVFFLQTSKGQAFAWLLRKSQPQPALPGFTHQRPKSWSWRIQPELQQPRRISSLSLAPGLAASEVGLSSLGGLGETEQLCTCPQLMSDLFRRKSGLSGMKELELAA